MSPNSLGKTCYKSGTIFQPQSEEVIRIDFNMNCFPNSCNLQLYYCVYKISTTGLRQCAALQTYWRYFFQNRTIMHSPPKQY